MLPKSRHADHGRHKVSLMEHAMQVDKIGTAIEQIPVSINYDIIRLFSEGLYRSPHKAVEELVSNSYDANARRVSVLLPEAGDGTETLDPLWVIDMVTGWIWMDSGNRRARQRDLHVLTVDVSRPKETGGMP